jgi:sulfite reductase beta subunit-like hemoprotein
VFPCVAFDALVALGVKYGDRSARAKAKIKLLVDVWGAERVRGRFDEEFAAARRTHDTTWTPLAASEHVGDGVPVQASFGRAIPQKQRGFFTIPALVPMGELDASAARVLASAAEAFGDGFVHLTPDQNAELQGVREGDVAGVLAAIEGAGLRTAGRGGIADVVACVGLEYCPLAVTHAMTMGEELARFFAPRRDDPRYADFRIHVSGCPHSCAKHQIADVGLSGATIESNGARVEAYAFYLGGNARERRLGTLYPRKIPRAELPHVLEAVLKEYEALAVLGERFSQTVERVGPETFFATIADARA